MYDEREVPDWPCKVRSFSGPSNRRIRFEKTAKSLAFAIMRNRTLEEGGCGCPVLVEGIRDERTLRELGFIGPLSFRSRFGCKVNKLVFKKFLEFSLKGPR